jgi:PAS domain S-box-containing protein
LYFHVSPESDDRGLSVVKTPGKEDDPAVPAGLGWYDVFDATADCMFITDSNFTIEKANRAFAGLIGQGSRSVVGRKCFEVVHGAYAPPLWCSHVECLESQASIVKTFFEPHLGLDLCTSVSPIRNNEGKVVGTVHVIRDVTQFLCEEDRNLKRTQDWLKATLMVTVAAFTRANERPESDLEVAQRSQIFDKLCIETKVFLNKGVNFLRKSAANLTFLNEGERYKAARHLHCVTKKLGTLLREFEKLKLKLGPSEKETAANIGMLMKVVVELSRDAHRLARRLYPEILKEQDPVKAIQKECKSFSALRGRKVTCEHSEVPYLIPGILSLGFVSILAEILENAGQSDGSGITVALIRTGNFLRLSVAGRGIDYKPGIDSSSRGFSAMLDWVRALKGEISVETGYATGNRIIVEVPLAGRKWQLGARLSERQREILSLIARGHLAKQIAAILDISAKTVEFHKYRMMKDLGVKSVPELVMFAIRNKLIAP